MELIMLQKCVIYPCKDLKILSFRVYDISGVHNYLSQVLRAP